LGEAVDGELSYDPEIHTTAFQGAEEIYVFFFICMGDVAICEDEFVIRDVVADEA